MRRLLTVLLVGLTAWCASARTLSGDVTATLRERLRTAGRRFGYDGKTDSFTVLRVQCASDMDVANDTLLLAKRNECLRLAELKAKAEIITLLRRQAAAQTVVRQKADGTKRTRTVSGTFAEMQLTGCRILDLVEATRDGTYAVGLVMTWSPADAEALAASLRGEIVPAPDWRGELETALRQGGYANVPGTGLFVDSNGYRHLYGAAMGDILKPTALERTAAMKTLGLLAEQKLRLAFYGDEAVSQQAQLMRTREENGDVNAAAAYAALLTVGTTKAVPRAGEVLSVSFEHPLLGKRLRLVVYAQIL